MSLKLPPATEQVRNEFARSRCVIVPDALSSTLVQRWRAEAERVATTLSRVIERQEDGHVLSYRVVTGETIQQAWPELWAFYSAPETLRWIAEITSEPRIYTSSKLQSAINLNVLEQPGNIYRWHFDAVPYTLILFLTDTEPEAGGILEVLPNCRQQDETRVPQPEQHGELLRVIARAGTAVLMDGSVCYHHVTQLVRPHLRLTIPMVYPNTRDHRRPANLDSYLYGAARQI